MINWKLRLKNKATLTALIGAVVLFAYQVAGAMGWDMPIQQQNVLDGVATILTLLAALGIIVDPTTQGVSDSPTALDYQAPSGGVLEDMPSELVTDTEEIPDQTPEVEGGE